MNTYFSLFGLAPTRIGGTEVFARELSLQLAELGWTSVLCFSRPPCEPVRAWLELPNVRIEVVPTPDQPSPANLLAAGRLFRKYKPEIFHAHYVGMVSAWPWTARACGIPRIYFTDHASRPAGQIPRRMAAWKLPLGRLLTLPITRALAVSDFSDRWLRSLGFCPADRIARVYNGVALGASGDGSAFRRRYGIPPDAALVTQVGNMIPEKGFKDLLKAARIVLDQEPSAHFAMVGEGLWRREFEQYAESLGIGRSVTWTGLVNDPVRDGVYAASDIVCLMSSWEEAFGFVVAEAMAQQKPMVVTSVGALPELIAEGETGFLVPRGDPQAMARRILDLIANPALRMGIGAEARRVAGERFDVRESVAQLLRLVGAGPNREDPEDVNRHRAVSAV